MTNNSTGWVFDDQLQRSFIAFLLFVIAIIGIFGNFLVIVAVSFSRKLHTISNVFVVNLSVADILTCATLGGTIAQLVNPLGTQVGPDWLCLLGTVVNLSCLGVSIITLASISLTRVLVVTKPFLAARLSRYVMFVWLIFIWIIPVTVQIVSNLIWDEEILGYNHKYGNCLPKNSHPQNALYNFLVVVVYFPLPLIVIVTSFMIIWIKMRRHSSDLIKYEHRELSSVSVSSSVTSSALQENTAKLRLQRRQVQITKNMMVVVVTFFVCIGPYSLLSVIPNTAASLPYFSLLLFINSSINPLIYAKHPHFKQIFTLILKGRWHDIPEKTTFLHRLLDR